MKLEGELPVVGSIAPDFTLVSTDLSELKLSDFAGKRLVLNIFPSLDTSVCAMSVRKFNQEAASYPYTFLFVRHTARFVAFIRTVLMKMRVLIIPTP